MDLHGGNIYRLQREEKAILLVLVQIWTPFKCQKIPKRESLTGFIYWKFPRSLIYRVQEKLAKYKSSKLGKY